jgi:hypothetical protein
MKSYNIWIIKLESKGEKVRIIKIDMYTVKRGPTIKKRWIDVVYGAVRTDCQKY